MLVFKYGVMGSSKTANAIMMAYDFEQKGLKILFVKPDLENRDGQDLVKSRIGLTRSCILWSNFVKLKLDCIDKIIIDECHFLKEEDIDYLANIVDTTNIDIICFGLKTDFQTKFFSGSKRLMEIADKIEEIENTCWCGKPASVNARIDINKNIIKSGKQVVLGSNDLYVPLCRKHYKENKVYRG